MSLISIIIPTYNEASTIYSLVTYLKEKADAGLIGEIIVADGGSSNQTVKIASQAPIPFQAGLCQTESP